jgi:hypothetical protein
MYWRASAGFVLLAGLPLGTPAQSHEQSQKKTYVKQTFGPTGVGRSAVGAGIQQARGAPHEWRGGLKGFGRRWGSALASNVVKHTIQFGVATARHEQINYQRSPEEGFRPRLKHALLATVITPRTDREGQTIAAGHISGVVGAGFISRLWQPARLHTMASGFATAGLIFGVDAGGNVLHEFWPEIRHPHRRTVAEPSPSRLGVSASARTR